jgi:hypothetical protein
MTFARMSVRQGTAKSASMSAAQMGCSEGAHARPMYAPKDLRCKTQQLFVQVQQNLSARTRASRVLKISADIYVGRVVRFVGADAVQSNAQQD